MSHGRAPHCLVVTSACHSIHTLSSATRIYK